MTSASGGSRSPSLDAPLHVRALDGRVIVRWVGTEMALSEEAGHSGQIQWHHPGIPFMQLVSLDCLLQDGAAFRMLAQLDSGDGRFGLYLVPRHTLEEASMPEQGSIFRTRELTELPCGKATVAIRDADGESVQRIDITIGGQVLACRAAEVHEESGGGFRIVDGDDSILVQVDGKHPCAPPAICR